MTIADHAQACYDLAVEKGIDTREAALEVVRALDRQTANALAVEFLVEAIARAKRTEVRRIEIRSTRDAETTAERRPRKGSKAWAAWAQTSRGRATLEREAEIDVHCDILFRGALGRVIDRYTEEIRVKWTAELLASEFVLPDGQRVTWGSATIEQHEARRDAFKRDAHANLEGAARHEHAIRTIRAAGRHSLLESVAA